MTPVAAGDGCSGAAPAPPPPPAGWARVAVRAGAVVAALSRRLGLGAGAVIGGRVALALHPGVLSRLAAGRRIVLVSGTNGKTTTSHLVAAVLRTAGAVAHNASGANMADGIVAALAGDPAAPFAVLEVDELHLARVAAAVEPAAVVLLNLTRDQLDRGSEVRMVADALRRPLTGHPRTTVVANCDDPMAVWAALPAARVVWVAIGGAWSGDATTCPACGRALSAAGNGTCGADVAVVPPEPRGGWLCDCGFSRPEPAWRAARDSAVTPWGSFALPLQLPGAFNTGNAVMAMAAASVLGIGPEVAAQAMARVQSVAGRYTVVRRGDHELRLLLAKNPAGFAEMLPLLEPARPLLLVVNARPADGLDTSWLWDVDFERLAHRRVVASGERAADLGVRLSYAEVEHDTVTEPLAGLALLPPGKVDVVANYSAFHRLLRRLLGGEGR